ncbi:MAG: hypothetical protein ABIZ80_19640 [Bryobacteraceae bacterium]
MIIRFPRSRNYTIDCFGEQTLAGLTAAETREFELLDAEPPVDEYGRLLGWEISEDEFPPNQARWLELYEKYKAAG